MSRLLVSLLAVFLTTTAASAGSLEGVVRTADGIALPQIVLVVSGPAGARTIVTGSEGRFHVDGLPSGTYTVTLETPGFVLAPAATFAVADGETAADLTLAPAPVRERVLVSATRGDAPASTLGVATTVLDREAIAERQAPSFLDLVQGTPGIAVARTGGLGNQGSLFVRGGESRFARILVDGVPVNEPGGVFDLGSSLAFEIDRVEIVRGAASSLYGTDALAGVVNIVTRRALPGEGPGFHAEAEGGSFDTRRFQGGLSGRAGAVDWNVGALRLDTDNELPNNAFEETAGAASLGASLGPQTNLRVVLRAYDSALGTPGQVAFGRPDLEGTFDRSDVVTGATLRHTTGRASHELRAGYAQTHQLSRDPVDSGSFTAEFEGQVAAFPSFDFVDALGYQNNVARLSAGYQADLEIAPGHLLSGGADLEHETGDVGSRAEALLSPTRTNAGGFLQDRFVIGGRAHVTLGGRLEHNDNFGWKAVPRAAVAVQLRSGPDATTLRASAGAGIKEPDFSQSYGTSFFAQGNPDLKPERSRTFDLGLEQRLAEGRVRVEVTAFDHRYFDQIAYQTVDFNTFEATYVNLGETKARGVESALELAPTPALALSAAYTYLDGEIVESGSAFDPVYAAGEPLLRRPKHQASFSATGRHGRLSGGATLLVVGSRADSDFSGIGLTSNDGYTRVDARVRLEVIKGLEAFVVGENLLDEEYMEALGYPALGRAVRAGLRFRSRK
jgi:vitamin B12 transporter